MKVMDEQAFEAQGVATLGARRKMLNTFEVVKRKWASMIRRRRRRHLRRRVDRRPLRRPRWVARLVAVVGCPRCEGVAFPEYDPKQDSPFFRLSVRSRVQVLTSTRLWAHASDSYHIS
jgi:hypothetical protein